MNQLTKDISTSGFLTSKDAVAKVEATAAAVEKDLQAFEKLTAGYVIEKQVDLFPDYTPIQYNDAVKLADRIFKSFTGEAFDTPTYRNFMNAVDNFNEVYFSRLNRSIGYNLVNIAPEDMRKVQLIVNRINNIITDIATAVSKRYKVAHSCLRYIEQSVNK